MDCRKRQFLSDLYFIFKIPYDGSRPSDDFHTCAVVAQLDRSFGSDNSDRQLSSAEKPHNKAIFRHRVLRFCSSLTTI